MPALKNAEAPNRAAVALVQIRAHSGDIAYVVSDIVRDGRGVARIILGDVLLHLSNDVSAYVGGLSIDTAAYARKQRLGRCTHAECEHGGGNHDERLGLAGLMDERVQHDPPDRNIQQAEAHDGQTHHGAASERELKAAVQRALGGVGRPCRGICCCTHTYVSCQTGEETAGKECERYPGVLDMEAIGQKCEQNRKDNEYDNNYFVLLLQIGHRALTDVLGYLSHSRGAFVFLLHLLEEDVRKH